MSSFTFGYSVFEFGDGAAVIKGALFTLHAEQRALNKIHFKVI